MSNVGRIITLVVEIQESKYPQWIIDAHIKAPVNGVKVKVISEGNVVHKYDKLTETLNGLNLSEFPELEEVLSDI